MTSLLDINSNNQWFDGILWRDKEDNPPKELLNKFFRGNVNDRRFHIPFIFFFNNNEINYRQGNAYIFSKHLLPDIESGVHCPSPFDAHYLDYFTSVYATIFFPGFRKNFEYPICIFPERLALFKLGGFNE